MSDTPTLQGRRVILGICGSIAAYKAAVLVRLLVRAGAEVRVLMTPAATEFVTPLTLATLSKYPVLTSVTSAEGWNNHVELGLWADVYVIAPATANTLARLANGLCDDILAAVYLSARCPVLLAPAMDVDMWQHPSTRANIARLQAYGNSIIPVGVGELASGLSGAGRLAEPEEIVTAIGVELATSQNRGKSDATPGAETLAGISVLVTAGPTYEPIDPVRFIGNRSSGKQGLALVEELLAAGARVELVLGPVQLTPKPHPRLQVHQVETAQQMFDRSTRLWPACAVGVLAAAVADYRPASVATEKIKKSDVADAGLDLQLLRNPDIAAALGAQKRQDQRLIGFALETQNGLAHARRKLERKQLDAIVLNLHTPQAAAFGADDNEVTILLANGQKTAYGRMPKQEVAKAIVSVVAQLLTGEQNDQ